MGESEDYKGSLKKKSIGSKISNLIRRIDGIMGLGETLISEEKSVEQMNPANGDGYDVMYPVDRIEFPQGTIQKYLFDDNAALYIVLPNDRHYNPQGILRYEVKNIKQSAEQIQELTRNTSLQGKSLSIERGDHYLPRSIDEITTEILGSTKSRAEFKNADVTLLYDNTEPKLTPAQEFILKQGGCGHTFRFATDSLPSLAMAAVIAGMCESLSIAIKSPIPGALGMSCALILGGVSLYHSIVPKESTVRTISGLLPKIRKELKSLEKITAAYDTAKGMDTCVKLSKEMSAQKEKLGYYWHALYTSLTQKCVSLTYTNESPEKVLDYFSQLRRKMKKTAQIPAEVKTEQKQITAALKPIPTLDEITLEQSWKKDENYGRRIDGRYELREFLGEGGMSKVYRAVTILGGKEAAIKFEKPETGSLKKKEKLIKILCGLKHENLVATTDANLDNQPAYAVMDLIDGTDLGKILEFARESKETKHNLRLENILSIARNIGEALHFLHSNGSRKIIHNDIKPSNIMIDEKGKAYLGDCDIADIERDMNSLLTGTTSQKASGAGTIEYMAPERRGIVKAPISEKSDIYSFGAVLYEMIAGQLPMTPNGLDKRTDLPEDLRQILCKCVAINPEDRYQTMKEALEDLNKLQIESKPIKLIIRKSEEMKEELLKEPETKPAETEAKPLSPMESIAMFSKPIETLSENLLIEQIARANPGLMDEESQKQLLDASEQALVEDQKEQEALFNSVALPIPAELEKEIPSPEEEMEDLISPEDLEDDEEEPGKRMLE